MIALKIFFACVALLLAITHVDSKLRVRGWTTGKPSPVRKLLGSICELLVAIAFAAAIGVVLTGCQTSDPQDGAELWVDVYLAVMWGLLVGFAGAVLTTPVVPRALKLVTCGLLACGLFALLTACGDTINPVRYQPVEVLVTKPCLAGRTPPAQAVLLTDPVCTLPAAECVRAAAADIAELQREARESRNLIRECSK